MADPLHNHRDAAQPASLSPSKAQCAVATAVALGALVASGLSIFGDPCDAGAADRVITYMVGAGGSLATLTYLVMKAICCSTPRTDSRSVDGVIGGAALTYMVASLIAFATSVNHRSCDRHLAVSIADGAAIVVALTMIMHTCCGRGQHPVAPDRPDGARPGWAENP